MYTYSPVLRGWVWCCRKKTCTQTKQSRKLKGHRLQLRKPYGNLASLDHGDVKMIHLRPTQFLGGLGGLEDFNFSLRNPPWSPGFLSGERDIPQYHAGRCRKSTMNVS